MNEIDESIINIGLGAARKFADGSRYDPVSELSEQDEYQCDGQGLQIDIRADEFGQTLDLFDHLIQLIIWIVFFVAGIGHAKGPDIRRVIFRAAGRGRRTGLHAGLGWQACCLCRQYLHKFVGYIGFHVR